MKDALKGLFVIGSLMLATLWAAFLWASARYAATMAPAEAVSYWGLLIMLVLGGLATLGVAGMMVNGKS